MQRRDPTHATKNFRETTGSGLPAFSLARCSLICMRCLKPMSVRFAAGESTMAGGNSDGVAV